jgi:hypothetical protein
MNHKAGERLILLGVGEEAIIRLAGSDEDFDGGLGDFGAVVELHRADRDPEVIPAQGVRIAARSYGAVTS